jgi:hypothetical protein
VLSCGIRFPRTASISDRSHVFGCGVSDKDGPITGTCA